MSDLSTADLVGLLRTLNVTVAMPSGNPLGTDPLQPPLTIGDIQDYYVYVQAQAVAQGARLAVSGLMILAMLALSRTYKSIMFTMYQLNFVLTIAAAALEVVGEQAPTETMVAVLAYGQVIPTSWSAGRQIAVAVILSLLILSLALTMVLQVFHAFADMGRVKQFSITFVATLTWVPTLILWIWRVVYDAVVANGKTTNLNGPPFNLDAHWISFAASSAVTSLIMSAKLWVAAKRRAKMGLEKFDPLRVILAMGLNNSLVAVLFSIVSLSTTRTLGAINPVLGCVTLVTSVFLPFGYLWAQVKVLAATANQEEQLGHGTPYLERFRDKLDSYASRVRGHKSYDSFVEPGTATTPTSLSADKEGLGFMTHKAVDAMDV